MCINSGRFEFPSKKHVILGWREMYRATGSQSTGRRRFFRVFRVSFFLISNFKFILTENCQMYDNYEYIYRYKLIRCICLGITLTGKR